MQVSFTGTVSDSSSVVQTPSFISCLGGWSQTIPQVKKPDLEVLGWRGYTWSMVERPVGRTVLPNSLKRHWRRLMVEILTLNYLATALVDIPTVSMLIAHSL
jgi:hypothetical protein